MKAEPAPLIRRTLDRHIARLNFGARFHAMLAGKHGDRYAKVMERDNWICCKCQIHLPGFMEIHHWDDNHQNNDEANLAAICRFCHDIEHPVWSAARGRLRLIAAPDIAQEEITRLAWGAFTAIEIAQAITLLSNEELEVFPLKQSEIEMIQKCAEHALIVKASVEKREGHLETIIGHSHPEAFWEALFFARSHEPKQKMEDIIDVLDDVIRVWPTAACASGDIVTTPVSARLSAWRAGRFTDVSEAFVDTIVESGQIDVKTIGTLTLEVQKVFDSTVAVEF